MAINSDGYSLLVRIEFLDGGLNDLSNFHGNITRARLTDGSKSVGLVVKTAPGDPDIRERLPWKEMYCNEIHFYLHIYPVLSRYGPLPTVPRVLWSCLEEGKETLVLEDLRDRGYLASSIEEGIGGVALDKALQALEKLHTASRTLRQKDPQLFSRLASLLQEAICKGPVFEISAHKCLENAINVAEKHLPEDYADKLRKFNIVDDMKAALRLSDDSVFTHGDTWPSNILYKRSETGEIEDIVFIDWQLCRIGSPLMDISYLLLSSAPHTPCPSTSTAARFGLGMTLILLPFCLGQCDASMLQEVDKLIFTENEFASSKIAAAIKSAVEGGVI